MLLHLQLSFFKSKDSIDTSPSTSTCTSSTSHTNYDSEDTVILSSDDDDEKNKIKKRKLDFYKGYTGDANFLGSEVKSNLSEEEESVICAIIEKIFGQTHTLIGGKTKTKM